MNPWLTADATKDLVGATVFATGQITSIDSDAFSVGPMWADRWPDEPLNQEK